MIYAGLSNLGLDVDAQASYSNSPLAKPSLMLWGNYPLTQSISAWGGFNVVGDRTLQV